MGLFMLIITWPDGLKTNHIKCITYGVAVEALAQTFKRANEPWLLGQWRDDCGEVHYFHAGNPPPEYLEI